MPFSEWHQVLTAASLPLWLPLGALGLYFVLCGIETALLLKQSIHHLPQYKITLLIRWSIRVCVKNLSGLLFVLSTMATAHGWAVYFLGSLATLPLIQQAQSGSFLGHALRINGRKNWVKARRSLKRAVYWLLLIYYCICFVMGFPGIVSAFIVMPPLGILFVVPFWIFYWLLRPKNQSSKSAGV